MNIQQLWTFVRTIFVPSFLVITCPILVFQLSKSFNLNAENLTWSESLFGNKTSWGMILTGMIWAFVFLKIPAKQHYGQPTIFGFTPRYHDNGFIYYIASCWTFTSLCYADPKVPQLIYNNIPALISTLNIIAVIFCAYLWYKGKHYRGDKEIVEELPTIFEFYRGMEIHPRIFDIDVKQFTNCRVGMMGWQALVICYWFFGYYEFGFNWGLTVSVILQTIYIAKFFWWEVGYFNTLDVILDRAGFYICWGCLVFLPGFYAFPTYYFIANTLTIDKMYSLIILCLGVLAIAITYFIDYEKQVFKSSNGRRTFWLAKPRYIEAIYDTANGRRRTKLLISGFWGISRHLNYLLELFCYYAWCLPGYNFGLWPFSCAIFLTILMIHRTYRDEEKCLKKYGAAWERYCKLVNYKMVPYVF